MIKIKELDQAFLLEQAQPLAMEAATAEVATAADLGDLVEAMETPALPQMVEDLAMEELPTKLNLQIRSVHKKHRI
jgi:hypothetical protein